MADNASAAGSSKAPSSIGGSSVASGVSGVLSALNGPEEDKGYQAQSGRSWVATMFSFVHAAPKLGMEASWKLQGAIMLYQIGAFLIYALHPFWEWGFNWETNVVTTWLLRVQLHGIPLLNGKYEVYVALVACMFCLTLLLCLVYAHVWYLARGSRGYGRVALVLLRLFEVFFVKMGGVVVLGVLLMPLACTWADETPVLMYVPSQECSGSWAVTAILGALGAVLYMGLSLMLTVKNVELDPFTRVPFSLGSIPAAVRIQVLQMLSLVAFHVVVGFSAPAAGGLMVALWAWVCYIHAVRVPFVGRAHSLWRSFCAGFITAALLGGAAKAGGAAYGLALAVALGGGAVLGAALAGLTKWRLSRLIAATHRFYALRAEAPKGGKRMHKFFDVEDLDALVRTLRYQAYASVGIQEEIEGCGALLAHGQASHYQNSAYACICKGLHQAFALNDVHTAHSSLQEGLQLQADTYAVLLAFSLDWVIKERASGDNTGDNLDWASYVELQSALQRLIKTHKEVLVQAREVWRACMSSDVGMDDISRQLYKTSDAELYAESAYHAMLEKYPKHVRLLRSYANFLEEVQGDSSAAQQYYQESDKLEDAAAMQADTGLDEDAGDGKMVTQVDESRDAVIVINPEGIIQFTNANLNKMWGFRRGDLPGRNVSMMMPPPFSQQHNQYLKNYMTTGQAKILNTVRKVVGLHRERYVFPFALVVTKITHNGREGFMAVIRPVEDDPRIAKIYMTVTGMIVAVSRGFTTMTGYSYNDVAGKQADVAFPLKGEWAGLVAQANEGGWQDSFKAEMTCRSTFGEDFKVDCSTELGGTDNVKLIVFKAKRLDEAKPMMVVSGSTGRIAATNVVCDNFLGYTSVQMKRMSLRDIMVEPFGLFHDSWTKAGLPQGSSAPCLSGRPVEVKHQSGSVLWATLKITKKPAAEDESEMVVMIQPMNTSEARARMVMTLSVNKEAKIGHASVAESTSGWAPKKLQGKSLEDVVKFVDGADVKALLQEWRESKGVRHVRVAVKSPSGQVKAASMDVELDRSATEKGSVTVTLNLLESVRVAVEFDKNLVIVGAKGSVSHMLAVPEDKLVGTPLQTILPRVAREAMTFDSILASETQAGGLKALREGKRNPSDRYLPVGAVGAEEACISQAMEKASASGPRAVMLLQAKGVPVPPPLGDPESAHPLQRAVSSSQALEQNGSKLTPPLASVKEAAAEEAAAEEAPAEEAPAQEAPAQEAPAGEPQPVGVADLPAEAETRGDGVVKSSGSTHEGGEDADEDEGGGGGGHGFHRTRIEDWVNSEGLPSQFTKQLFQGKSMVETGLTKRGLNQLEETFTADEIRARAHVVDVTLPDRPAHASAADENEQPHGIIGRQPSHLSAAERLARRQKRMSSGLDGDAEDANRRPKDRKRDSVGGALPDIPEDGKAADSKEEKTEEADKEEEEEEEEDVPISGFAAKLAGKGQKKMIKAGEMDDLKHLGAAAPVQVIGGDGGAKKAAAPSDPALAHPAPRAPPSDDGKSDAGKSAHSFASRAMSRQSKVRDNDSQSDMGAGLMAVGAETFAHLDVEEAEGDEDVLNLLEGDGVAERGRKAKRLHTLLTSSLMQKPMIQLRTGLWIVVACILVVHTLCFSLFMWRLNFHDHILESITRSGNSMHTVAEIMMYAWMVQGIGMGLTLPVDLDFARDELKQKISEMEVMHEELYESTQAEMPAWRSKLVGLWMEPVVQLAIMDSYRDGVIVNDETTTKNLWDAGNDFIAHAQEVQEVPEDEISDLYFLQSFRFCADNGLTVIAPRYAALMDMHVERAKANLADIGTFAMVFLVIEVFLVVPASVGYLHVLMKRVLSMRITLLSVLLAVPKQVMHEYLRKKIIMDALEEDEEDEENDVGNLNDVDENPQEGERKISKKVRAMLGSRLQLDAALAGKVVLLANRRKLRTHRVMEMRVAAPFLVWGVTVAILLGVTFQLQASSQNSLQPKRTAEFMGFHTLSTGAMAIELVMRTEAKVRGIIPLTDEKQQEVRDRLKNHVNLMKDAEITLMFGTESLEDHSYEGEVVLPGTVFMNKKIRSIHFGDTCFDMCDSDDPVRKRMESSLKRGFFPLIVRIYEEATLLSTEIDADLTMANPKVRTLFEVSVHDVTEAIHISGEAIMENVKNLVALEILHILLLICTVIMCLAFLMTVLTPVQNNNRIECKRLSFTLADLPREMRVDELVVAMREEQNRKDDEEDVLGAGHDAPEAGKDDADADAKAAA